MNSYSRIYNLLCEFQTSPEGKKHLPAKTKQCPSCREETKDTPKHKTDESEFVNELIKDTEAEDAAKHVINVLHQGKSTPKPTPYVCPGCAPNVTKKWRALGFNIPHFGEGGEEKSK